MNNSEKEAVALEYRSSTTPVVTAKGESELAEVIIQAKKQGIYIAGSQIIGGSSSIRY